VTRFESNIWPVEEMSLAGIKASSSFSTPSAVRLTLRGGSDDDHRRAD